MSTPPLFKELKELIDSQQYKKALHVIYQILSIDEKDTEALECKVLCLIHIGQFDECLEFIASKSELAHKQVEKAYCLYRLRRYREASDVLQTINTTNTTPAVAALRAQLAYSLADYERCCSHYKQILSQSNPSNHTELLVNYAAACAASNQPEQAMSILASNSNVAQSSYEFLYNVACSCISSRSYSVAEDLLKQSEELCIRVSKEEGYDDDDIANEVAIIRVQSAFIAYMLGNTEKAESILDAILKQKPRDLVVSAIAENNHLVLRPDEKLFNAEKKLAQATTGEVQSRLLPQQLEVLSFNHALVLLKMNKIDQCKAILDSLSEKFSSNATPVLIRASLLFREKKADEGISLLRNFLESRSNDSQTTSVRLTLAQLLLKENRIEETLAIFYHLHESDLYRPAFVATVVALLEKRRDFDEAANLFERATSFWEAQSRANPKTAQPVYVELLRAAGGYFVRNKRADLAVSYYSRLLDLDGASSENLPSLVKVLAYEEPEIAQKYLPKLPQLVIPSDINAENLENLPAPKERASAVSEEGASTTTSTPTAIAAIKKKKSKKKKKKRLPKNYPDCPPPNPERWLPRTERKGYKKRKKDLSRGSQGIALKDSKSDGLLAQPSAASSSSSSSGANTAAPPRGAPAARGGGKKAQRGGKRKR